MKTDISTIRRAKSEGKLGPSRRLLLSLGLSLLFAASGCASAPKPAARGYQFGAGTPGAALLNDWFSGDLDVDASAPPAEAAGLEELFARAEIAYFMGDLEDAGALYLRMLKSQAAHPLGRFAAARLYSMRHELTRFSQRMAPILSEIRLGDVPELTRVQLALIAQVVARHQWNISEDSAPFSGDQLGFPTRWTTSPLMSTWRLTDFERAFGPESDASIQPEYRSPAIAEDAAINYEKSRIYHVENLSISPNFERSGVYYLETFAELSEDAGVQDFLLYASSSARVTVWINGELALERGESGYGPGERLRRVRLSPGEHRVLVKIAYQKNYRDRFDIAFLADQATPLEGSGLSFNAVLGSVQNGAGEASGRVELLGEQHTPAQLDSALVDHAEVKSARDDALYLALNAAYLNGDAPSFSAAWAEFMARYDAFAPAYLLRSRQLQTLWEVPSRMRDAQSLTAIRRAHKLAPESLQYGVRLGRWLRDQGKKDEEVQDILRANRDAALDADGELRHVGALRAWAEFQEDEGLGAAAEEAWREVLAAAPADCRAARALQDLYYERSYYPDLAEISPEYSACPALKERQVLARRDNPAERLKILERDASRRPFRVSAQTRYAKELLKTGSADAALAHLEAAQERIPWSANLDYEIARLIFAQRGPEAGKAAIEAALERHKDIGWLHWRLAMLENRAPLASLMRDAKERAMQDVARVQALDAGEELEGAEARTSGDEAYYVLDFGATKYFPDGSSITLTHNLVRLMTKGAIDRFGEFSPPTGAQMLQLRTIKQDGTTRVPEYTAGKSAMSLPGLAPGDFVDIAYLQFSSPSALSNTRRQGIRFFFRMGDISSRHSEYLVLGGGEEYQRLNHAPEAEKIDTDEGAALRFVREDSPRPRREPSQPGWEEFLPWIQLHHGGIELDSFEASRRTIREQIRDNSKLSPALARQIDAWREEFEPGSEEEVRGLFHRVSAWITDPSMTSFSTAISHAYLDRSGNPLMLLKAAYDQAGIPAEIYFIKSAFQAPAVYKVGEFSKYRSPLLKVKMPDGRDAWVYPEGPDAMFESVGLSALGQPAVCVSCEEAALDEVPAEERRPSTRVVKVRGELGADGELKATMTLSYHGVRAAMLRATLRRRADKSSREKLVDLTISELLPGANLKDYQFSAIDEPDEPLLIRAEFELEDFARPTKDGGLELQTQLFQETLASDYAELAERQTPLLVPYQYDFSYDFELKLPDNAEPQLRSQNGEWTHEGAFGAYSRGVELDPTTLRVRAALKMPVQRVSTDAYADFRRWALDVERSAHLRVRFSKP